jgi:two-component system, NarL family, response regulator NreC
MTPIRILLAEDHRTVREGLRLMLDSQRDMEVVAEVDDGQAALERVREAPPDVVLMDISMPGMNGLLTTRAMKQDSPGVKIVILTRHSDEAYFFEMLRAGVAAYVLKQSATTELLQAIRTVAQGGEYVDSSLTSRMTRLYRKRGVRDVDGARALTEREEEVLRHVAWGQSNKEIAAAMGLSVKTVEVHKANAMKKLGTHSRIDVVRFGVLKGWLQDPGP